MSALTFIGLHGLGASKESFGRLREAGLGGRFVARDFAGFGERCGEAVLDTPLDAAAREIAREIRREGYERVVLLGHSMGGAVGLLVAELVPERVAGVVSIEGNLIAEDCGMLSRKLASAPDVAACDALKQEMVARTREAADPGLRAWSAEMARVSAAALLSYSRHLVELSDSGVLLERFRGGAFRTLYLHGDGYVGHVLLGRLPPVPVVYVPGASHNVMVDAPEACAAAIAGVMAAAA